MADTPTTARPAARDRAFERQLREMNEALFISSVRQQELAEVAQKAEAALRQSEVRYRTLVKATGAITWSCPRSGLHIEPQPEWMAFTGQSAGEMLGDGWTKAVHPDDLAAAGSKWGEAVASGLLFSNEHRIRRHDGQWRWMRVLAVPILDAADDVLTWFGSNVDITDRKVAEATLRTSENRYRRLFEAAHDGVLILDPETRKIVDANPFMTGLLGYTREQLIGMELNEIGFLVDAQASRDMFQTLKAMSQIRYESLPLKTQGGNVQEVEMVANLYAENSQSVIQCNVRDITERKQAEGVLRQSRDTYLNLIENNPFGVYLIDSDFRVVQASVSVQSAFGAIVPLIGRDFEEVVRILWQEPLAGEVIARFRHTLETGEGYHSKDTTGKRANRNTEESYDWQLERVKIPSGRFGVVCYFYDLTERKRFEEHIVLLMNEVNHRAKNLLAVVQAVAKQTAKHSSPEIFMERLSERIDGLAANQDLLVKNQWRGIEVANLVEAQLAHLKDLIGTRVQLDGPPVRLTPAAAQGIGMALHELATNAAKYGSLSNSKGRVRISWQVTAAEKPTFSMSWSEDGGPSVASPTRKGFGQTVIGRMVEAAVDGTAEIDYRESGFSWKLDALVVNSLETDKQKGSASVASR